jgi:hypothetical protein
MADMQDPDIHLGPPELLVESTIIVQRVIPPEGDAMLLVRSFGPLATDTMVGMLELAKVWVMTEGTHGA